MLGVYLAALVAALGVFGVQLLGGHHDAGAHDATHDGGDQEASAWSLVASIRFWSFALLAFGLVGSALSLFALAGGLMVALLAAASGVASGFFAASIISSLASKPATSHSVSSDVVGRIGRVIVPLVPGGLGKVRVEMKGGVIDYVAQSRDPIEAGESVLIEEADEGEVVVSRVAKELAP